MNQFALSAAGVLFITFACMGQSISTVTPAEADAGQELAVSIVCADDRFTSCTQAMSGIMNCLSTVSRVYFKNGDSVRVASAVSNVQTTSLVADMSFPLTCPAGVWDVVVEHVGGTAISKTEGFTLNPPTNPILVSVNPSTVYPNRKITLTFTGAHTHFKIARENSMIDNVTAVRLIRDAFLMQADSFSVENCFKMSAYFTLGGIDSGYYDVEIVQGNGLPPVAQSMALFVRSAPDLSNSLPDGCVAYYPFEGDAVDFSDHGNNGTMYGTSWVDGVYGSGLYFNGSSSYVSIPNSGSFAIANGLSLCAWIKPEKGNMWYRIVGKANSGNYDNDWLIGVAMSGGVYFSIWKDQNQFYTDGKTALALNQWNHVAGAWDGSCMRIYLNGVLQKETVTVAPPVNNSTNPVIIGKRPDNTYYFTGAMDEIMIINRGISAEEVEAIYTQTYRGSYSVPFLIRYNGRTVESLRPTFVWNKVSGATTYKIEIAKNASFSNFAVATPLADTAYMPLVDLNEGMYYWRVSSDRNFSQFCARDSLVIRKPPTRSIQHNAGFPAVYSCVVGGRPGRQSGSFIQFGLPKASMVTLKVYDIRGKLLKDFSRFYRAPGYFQNPLDMSGFPRGFYIVDFKAGAYTLTKRTSNLF
jgi:hypothetical protein